MKICLCITEDWYLKSHYLPLLDALRQLSDEVIVITRVSGDLGEIEMPGVRVIDFDWNRTSMNPVKEAKSLAGLTKILRREKPDSVHLVAMKPITIGGMAFRLSRVPRVFVHLSGVGFLIVTEKLKTRIVRQVVMRLLGSLLNAQNSWLFAQNPDDFALLQSYGASFGERCTMVGGAGVDPDYFSALPDPQNSIPHAGYVGRMLGPKGVDVLVEAHSVLRERGVDVALDLYGAIDEGNPQAISRADLEVWNAQTNITWHGHLGDVREAWRKADIAVVPSSEREGTPRAMLEAAACGRALIVTDVPGSAHFCRDGVEGLVVPAKDANALADALERLANDPALRARMGAAARERILENYTAEHYAKAVIKAYGTVFGSKSGSE